MQGEFGVVLNKEANISLLLCSDVARSAPASAFSCICCCWVSYKESCFIYQAVVEIFQVPVIGYPTALLLWLKPEERDQNVVKTKPRGIWEISCLKNKIVFTGTYWFLFAVMGEAVHFDNRNSQVLTSRIEMKVIAAIQVPMKVFAEKSNSHS